MGAVSAQAWLMSCYGIAMVLVAWAFDRVARRGAARSAAWRTGNFVYHPDHDAWKCHEDQWLWPASFDPDKRVIRYQGQHAICGRCPAKASCSPSPGPRELTRPVDPWPHSETGRFHRGIALAVGLLGVAMPVAELFDTHSPIETLLLLAVAVLGLAATAPLARHLWNQPVDYPEHLASNGPELVDRREPRAATVDQLIDRYATTYGIARRRTPADPGTSADGTVGPVGRVVTKEKK